MRDLARWALFHRFDDGLPVEFFEVRQHRETIWTCAGQTLTWGESGVTPCRNTDEADAAFAGLLADAMGRGLVEVARGDYRPGTFDFDALMEAVKLASKLSFKVMLSAHGADQICGFGLLTDPDSMTIAGVGQTEDAIARADEDARAEARWFVGAWSMEDGSEHFDIPYRMILRQSRGDIPFEEEMDADLFAAGCFEAFVSALEALRLGGTFEVATSESFVLLVNVSDSDEIEGMAERLNAAPEVLDGYHQFMG